MVNYSIVFTKDATKDIPNLKSANLVEITKNLIGLIRENPYQTPPAYEKLVGNLSGCYSRRINHKHRLVYQVYEKEKVVKIISMWSHYEF